MHLVPVPWVEYSPIKRVSEMIVGSEECASGFTGGDGTVARDGLIAMSIAAGYSLYDAMNILGKKQK